LPFLTDRYYLNFYGGEPLLCLNLIKQTLSFLDEKNKGSKKEAQYSITTNGSLITKEAIQTFSQHNFSVVFSFDGLAQNIQRKHGSFKGSVSHIKEILRFPNIHLEINSVFTSDTVDYISASMTFIIELGAKNINLSLSFLHPWSQHSLEQLKEEMAKLRKRLVSHYRESQEIPVMNFREDDSKGYFYCAGGQDRLAVTSKEHVWGCDVFADYLDGKEKFPEYQEYFFGNLDSFAKNHEKIFPRVSSNYAKLSMNNFRSAGMECLFCSNLEKCTVCPVAAAFTGSVIGEIPPFVCEIQKIRIREKQKFREEIRRKQ
jgi:sulfatase maturation enzyme AslB (radical SAM superfamily)